LPGLAEEPVAFRFAEPEAPPNMARGTGQGGPLPAHLSFEERFRFAVARVPRAKRQAALGKSPRSLDRYAAGDEVPVSVIRRLAEASAVPIDWLVSGKGAADDTGGEVYVRRLWLDTSAGDASGGEGLHFPGRILDQVGIQPTNARFLEAAGDSMAPTLNDGDLMLVDVAARDLVEGKIYVITIGAEVFVKRLRRAPGRIVMMSDNRDLHPEPEAVPAGDPFSIIGRVKWAGRQL